jgi:hypothetical protein
VTALHSRARSVPGEYRIPGCNHADADLKRPAQEGQPSSLPGRILGCSACRDRTLVWNQRHLMIVLWEYEDLYNMHRPHRALKQAAPLPLPDGVADLDCFRVQRRDRAGGVIHEYRLVA